MLLPRFERQTHRREAQVQKYVATKVYKQCHLLFDLQHHNSTRRLDSPKLRKMPSLLHTALVVALPLLAPLAAAQNCSPLELVYGR